MSDWTDITGDTERFKHWREKDRITSAEAAAALDEWLHVAKTGFLGLLHLDEVQNFFKIAPVKERRRHQDLAAETMPELRIAEDKTLRWVFQIKHSRIPLLVSGTPDGIHAFTKRFSSAGKLLDAGAYHRFDPFYDPQEPIFIKTFLQQGLGRYQLVKHRLPVDGDLAGLVVNLTAGVQRIIVALWISAHRVAFDRGEDALSLPDFVAAANTWLAPLAPAIEALRSRDARRMAMYEDLVRRDSPFWADFWTRVTSA